MAIVKMKRLRIVALSGERDELLGRLLHAGCVEVTEPEAALNDPEWKALLRRDTSALSEVKSKQNAVNAALDALDKFAKVKGGLFLLRKSIKETEFLSDAALDAALDAAGEINSRTQRIAQLHTQENRMTAQRASLVPWAALDLALDTPSTAHAQIAFAACPAGVDLEEVKGRLVLEVPTAELIEASGDKDLHYLLLVCHRDEAEALAEAVKPWSFSTVNFKEFHGTAADNIARIDDLLKEFTKEREALGAEIAQFGARRQDLRICADRLTVEVSKQMARERLLTNGTVVFLEGWVTEPGLPKVEEELLKFACAWESNQPLEEEEPPVLLHNPHWMDPINMVTEMFSMPAYRGIDPNPFIFWFFTFFFGFMFADVAYGLIIFGICLFITKKYDPKNTMGYMFRLGQYMGISAAICGFFVGGFFGDAIPQVCATFFGIAKDQLPGWLQTFNSGILLNPMEDPMSVLVVAIGIGVFQLLFGQFIHIYMGVRDHCLLDALMDVVPWWLFFGTIGLVVAGFPWWVILIGVVIIIAAGDYKKRKPMPPKPEHFDTLSPKEKRGWYGKCVGWAVKTALFGFADVYDVTAWLSDILSYSRLMALMLVTSVIASVMNTLGTLGGRSVVGVIMFVVIFIIGHVFNIGVNIIGTYVHAARLQYLEFYGKFYVEGGEPFEPLTYNTKFVDIVEEE